MKVHHMTRARQPLDPKNPDRRDPRRRAWRGLMTMHAVLTAVMDEELKESADMDLNTYDALLHLFEAGSSGLRMNELADTIVVSHSGLTNRIDRLAERDLVE